MKVVYENDVAMGAGYGVLRCTDAVFPAVAYTFGVMRGSDQLWLLGTAGWGAQGGVLTPRDVQVQDDGVAVYIDSDVVNELDPQENYRIELKAATGETFAGRFRPVGVLAGAGSGGGLLVDAAAQAKVAAAQREAADAERLRLEEVRRQAEADAQTSAPLNALPLPAKKSNVAIVLLALFLVAALAGAAWWFLLKDPSIPVSPAPPVEHVTPAEKPKPDEPKPDEPKAETPHPATEPQQPAPATPATQAPVVESVEAQVASFLGASTRTAQAAAALSKTLSASSKHEQDAVFRLYYFAAENGDTSVLMPYAGTFDPAMPAWGSIEKDAEAAWDIYERAKATHPEAAQAQQTLKMWLEKEAGAGNTQAATWLKNVQ